MKTPESVVRGAIEDLTGVPVVRRVVNALDDYLMLVLLPLILSEDKKVRDAAGVIYDRFINGVTEDSAPKNGSEKPAITEVKI